MLDLIWLPSIRAHDIDAVRRLINESESTHRDETTASSISSPLLFTNNSTPLHWAAESGSVELCQLMLEHTSICGALSSTDASGGTPMHWAAGEGHVDVVRLFEARGAPIDARDENGENVLHFACLSGHEAVVKFLVEQRGTSLINVLSLSGHSPLHFATMNRHVRVVSLLIDKGADVDLKAPGGQSPHELALAANDADLLANFVPSSKRLLDRVIALESRERQLQSELAAATDKAHQTSLRLRDLFRDYGELEAREKQLVQQVAEQDSLLAHAKEAALDRDRCVQEAQAALHARVEQLTQALAQSELRANVAPAVAVTTDSASRLCERCGDAGGGGGVDLPLSSVDIASLHVTLQQLNILLGLTNKAVGDTQQQCNLVTQRMDRLAAAADHQNNDQQ
jgi:ankyrin repeat protein